MRKQIVELVVVFSLLGATAAIVVSGCKGIAPDPKQIEKAACSIIQASTDPAFSGTGPAFSGTGPAFPPLAGQASGIIDTICAIAPEITQIVEDITADRLSKAEVADAGRVKLALAQPGCTYIPTTNVCATEAELAPAIKHVLAKRALSTLPAEGGTSPASGGASPHAVGARRVGDGG